MVILCGTCFVGSASGVYPQHKSLLPVEVKVGKVKCCPERHIALSYYRIFYRITDKLVYVKRCMKIYSCKFILSTGKAGNYPKASVNERLSLVTVPGIQRLGIEFNQV